MKPRNLILILLVNIITLLPIITHADSFTINDIALTHQTITAIKYNDIVQSYTFTTTPANNNTKSFTWLLKDVKQTEATTKELTNKYLNKQIQILYSKTDNYIFRQYDIIEWKLKE